MHVIIIIVRWFAPGESKAIATVLRRLIYRGSFRRFWAPSRIRAIPLFDFARARKFVRAFRFSTRDFPSIFQRIVSRSTGCELRELFRPFDLTRIPWRGYERFFNSGLKVLEYVGSVRSPFRKLFRVMNRGPETNDCAHWTNGVSRMPATQRNS